MSSLVGASPRTTHRAGAKDEYEGLECKSPAGSRASHIRPLDHQWPHHPPSQPRSPGTCQRRPHVCSFASSPRDGDSENGSEVCFEAPCVFGRRTRAGDFASCPRGGGSENGGEFFHDLLNSAVRIIAPGVLERSPPAGSFAPRYYDGKRGVGIVSFLRAVLLLVLLRLVPMTGFWLLQKLKIGYLLVLLRLVLVLVVAWMMVGSFFIIA